MTKYQLLGTLGKIPRIYERDVGGWRKLNIEDFNEI
jgi:hypothetical protein